MAGLNMEILQEMYNNSDGDSLHEFLSERIKTEIFKGLSGSKLPSVGATRKKKKKKRITKMYHSKNYSVVCQVIL
jgi:hypothetical protein